MYTRGEGRGQRAEKNLMFQFSSFAFKCEFLFHHFAYQISRFTILQFCAFPPIFTISLLMFLSTYMQVHFFFNSNSANKKTKFHFTLDIQFQFQIFHLIVFNTVVDNSHLLIQQKQFFNVIKQSPYISLARYNAN